MNITREFGDDFLGRQAFGGERFRKLPAKRGEIGGGCDGRVIEILQKIERGGEGGFEWLAEELGGVFHVNTVTARMHGALSESCGEVGAGAAISDQWRS